MSNIRVVLKIIYIVSFFGLTQIFSNQDDEDNVMLNGIAAIIDKRVITMEDLQRKVVPYVRQIQREATSAEDFEAKMKSVTLETLDNMVNDILIVNEFKSNKKLKIPSSIIENHYTKFMGEQFQNNRSQYHQYLEENGINERELKEQHKDQMIIGFKRSNLKKSEAEISPWQINKYYNENKQRFMQKESVHLRQIVLRAIDEDNEESTLLLAKAAEVLNKLKRGEKFADVAKEYSEDDMRSSGGDWGWINRSDIREELANVAFSLNKAHFSDVVLLDKYAFILFIEDKKQAGAIPVEEVRSDIEKILVNEFAKKAEAQHIQRLRKKSYIKYFI